MRLIPSAALAMPLPYAVAESIKNKPREQRASAFWTLFGTWLMLTAFAVINSGFSEYWHALGNLLSGHASIDQLHSGSLLRMAPTVAAMVSLDILVMFPIGILVQLVVRGKIRVESSDDNQDDHKLSTLFHTDKPKGQYGRIMVTLTLEELLARWLFLGVLAQIPALKGNDAAFYALFVGGNLLWALLHLNNIKDKNKLKSLTLSQKLMFVLPQTVGGVMITAIYIPYGLLGAFIAHVVFDMVLFAMDRVDVFNLGEALICIYHFLVGTAALCYFIFVSHLDVRDMKAWLTNDLTSFALPGWGFWDYTAAIVMLTSYGILALELLLYDREGGETKSEMVKDWWYSGVFMLAAYVVVKGTRGVTYLPMAGIVIVLALLGAFFIKSCSGSGVARIFWEGMLISSVVICGLLAMDEQHSLGLMVILMLLWLPDRIIRFFDKDDLPEPEHAEDCPHHDHNNAEETLPPVTG